MTTISGIDDGGPHAPGLLAGPASSHPVAAPTDPRPERRGGGEEVEVARARRPEFLATRSRKLLRDASLVAAQDEALLTLPDDQITALVVEFCEGALIPAARRRTMVQVIVSDKVARSPEGHELVVLMGCSGVVLRRSHHPLPDVAVFGRRLAVWRAEGEVPGWLCSNHPRPVNNALKIFRAVWRTANPVGVPEPEPVLSQLESNILQHLVAGSKDESAARDLNVSTRTYRRHVTAMCCRLGASSRFEAGAKAALSGWIPQRSLF